MNLDGGPIIVPLDGSKNAESALPVALQLAEAYGSELRFVHVVDIDSYDPATPLQVSQGQLEDYVRGLMERRGASVEWSISVRAGSPAQEILEASAGGRVIVMATHGHGGFQAAFIGSVTDKVVRSCRMPVITVPLFRESDLRAGPILIGLDGSRAAEAALHVARGLASRLGVRVALLKAFSMPAITGSEFGTYTYNSVGMFEEAAADYLAAVSLPGEEVLTPMATPACAIDDAVQRMGASLVVLSSHGKGLAHRLALGSTTDRVIHSVRRPVLVLPANQEQAAGAGK